MYYASIYLQIYMQVFTCAKKFHAKTQSLAKSLIDFPFFNSIDARGKLASGLLSVMTKAKRDACARIIVRFNLGTSGTLAPNSLLRQVHYCAKKKTTCSVRRF